MLIDLINDYEDIYFSNNVCVGVCEMVFMRIDTFKRLFFSMKKCYGGVFVFVCVFFERDYEFNCFFSMKRGYRNVLGTSKNVWGLWVCFFNMILN